MVSPLTSAFALFASLAFGLCCEAVDGQPEPDCVAFKVRSVGHVLGNSISKDGRFVAHTDWKTGKIMLRDLRTGGDRALTSGGYPGYGMYGQISPDGKRVAYGWRVAGGEFDLRIVSLEDSTEVVLRDGKADGNSYFPMDWSSDGEHILVRTNDTLALVSSKSTTVQDIHSFAPKEFTNWAWLSPDNELVAFNVCKPDPAQSPSDIFIYSLKTRRIVASVTGPADDQLMGWMPKDNRCILFSSNRDGRRALYAACLHGEQLAEPVCLLKSLAKARVLSLGVADGSLYFCTSTWENDIYFSRLDRDQSTFSKPEKIVSDVNYQSSPSWSPDGKRFVFSRSPATLVLRTYPEGNEREIPLRMRRYHFVGPQWSADGESLVVEARPNGASAGLISVDVQNGEISPLIRNASEGVVEWVTGAPKGKAYFVRRDAEGGATGRGRIVERNMSTGDERPVYRYESQVAGGSPIRHLAVSWDGIHLAFLERIGGVPTALSVLDVNGGKPERVFSVKAGKVLYRPAWTPDGSILVGVGTAIGPDSQLELWKVEPKTATAKRLKGESLAGRSMGGLSVHPDGKKIIFTAARIFSEGDERLTELLRVEDVKMK